MYIYNINVVTHDATLEEELSWSECKVILSD